MSDWLTACHGVVDCTLAICCEKCEVPTYSSQKMSLQDAKFPIRPTHLSARVLYYTIYHRLSILGNQCHRSYICVHVHRRQPPCHGLALSYLYLWSVNQTHVLYRIQKRNGKIEDGVWNRAGWMCAVCILTLMIIFIEHKQYSLHGNVNVCTSCYGMWYLWREYLVKKR